MSLPTRPSLAAWKDWGPDTVRDLIKVVQHLIETRQLTQIELANQLELKPQTIQRWRDGDTSWSSIKPEYYEAAVNYLYKQRLLPLAASGITQAEHRALVAFFGETDEQHCDIASNADGDYRVHRYSNAKRGYILCGRLHIAYNRALRLFETQEYYRALIDKQQVSWPRHGYFVGRRPDGFAMLSRKHNSHEVQTAYLRVATRRNEGPKPQEFLKLDGIVFDMQNATVYATGIELVKVKEPVTDDEIRDFIPKTPDERRIGRTLKQLLRRDGAIVEF